jgi:hypothetical protein
MFKIQKVLLVILPFLIYLNGNSQIHHQLTRADALKEINDTLLINKTAIIKNERHTPFYLISYCFAHKDKFRFKQETLNKLLDFYIISRNIKDVEKRKDTEIDNVFDVSNTYQLDILFWLTCTDIYKNKPGYDYYKAFNIKE